MEIAQLLLAFFSFLLGSVAKYADLVNEHGLKEHFKGAGIFSGYVWGLSGVGMIICSPLAGLTYVAHVLYWFWRVKLEYTNHAIAGVLMLLAGFFFTGDFLFARRWDLLAIFLAYLVTGYIQTYCKNNFPATQLFWRLRLRIYLIPFVYSLYTNSWDPILATACGMFGAEWVTLKYRDYWADRRVTQ